MHSTMQYVEMIKNINHFVDINVALNNLITNMKTFNITIINLIFGLLILDALLLIFKLGVTSVKDKRDKELDNLLTDLKELKDDLNKQRRRGRNAKDN